MSVRCESSNGSMSFCAYVKYIPPRCPSVRKREWIRQVEGHRFPYSTECYELLSTKAFGVRVSDCRPLDYGECALFRKLNLFRHCLLSLFRNTGACAPLFGEPPVALRIVSRMCLVSPCAYVTPYRILRVCACAYILCVYMLCLFSDIYVHRPKGSESLSGSFMRLSRAACAKCRG